MIKAFCTVVDEKGGGVISTEISERTHQILLTAFRLSGVVRGRILRAVYKKYGTLSEVNINEFLYNDFVRTFIIDIEKNWHEGKLCSSTDRQK